MTDPLNIKGLRKLLEEDLFLEDEELDYNEDSPSSQSENELLRDSDDEDDCGNRQLEERRANDKTKDLGDMDINKRLDEHKIPSTANVDADEHSRQQLDDDDGEHSKEDLGNFMKTKPTVSLSSRQPSKGPREMGMSLEEVCRDRNILPLPKQQRTSWRDFSTLPKAGNSPGVGVSRNSNTTGIGQDQSAKEQSLFRQRHKGAPGEIRGRNQPISSAANASQMDRNEKLKQGLRSLVKMDDPGFESISSELANKGTPMDPNAPAWEPDPWHCINMLSYQGYGIYWTMSKLKEPKMENPTHAQRFYKCFIQYREHTGVCEAGQPHHARLGASSDFLENLRKRLPQMGKLQTQVNPASLVNPSICNELMERLKKERGSAPYYKFEKFTTPVNSRSLHKCVLTIGPVVYTEYSYVSAKLANLGAWKQAYETLLMERYPLQRIFMGKDCIMDDSLYKGMESQMTHYYDFSQAPVLPPGSTRGNYKAARNKRPLIVSYYTGKETSGKDSDEEMPSTE